MSQSPVKQQKSLLSFFRPDPPPAKRPKPDESIVTPPAPIPAIPPVSDLVETIEDSDDDGVEKQKPQSQQKVTPPLPPPPPHSTAPAPAPAPPKEQKQQQKKNAEKEEEKVTWWWLNDQGTWSKYPDELSQKIEKARMSGSTRCEISAERFIDFPSVTQRRTDDPSKRRQIKRTVVTSSSSSFDDSAAAFVPAPLLPTLVVNQNQKQQKQKQQQDPPKPTQKQQEQEKDTKKKSAKWMWRDDSDWKQYEILIEEKLELAFQAKKDSVPIDMERYVDLKAMFQVRFDDNQKKRVVKREVVDVDGKKKEEKKKEPHDEGPIVWLFCLEESNNTWSEYPKEISARIEEAAKKRLKTAKVDDERFVDLVNMVQRRFDDKTRMRYVRRGAAPVGAKVITPPSPAQQQQKQQQNQNQQKESDTKVVDDNDKTMMIGIDDDKGNDTEPDEKLQRMSRIGSGIDNNSGDETEDDEKLKQVALENQQQKHSPAVIEAAAAAPIVAVPDSLPLPVDESGDDKTENESSSEDETKMTLDEKRKRYRCGMNFTTLDKIPTWQQWLEKSHRDYRQAFFAPSFELNNKVALWQGDMTAVEIDAIVNAAKPSLMGGGGIDGAIHKAAGHRLHAFCLKLGGCNVGESRLTPGFRLPAKYIIHSVGPIGEKPDLLMKCYTSALDTAKANGIRTLAICCISTGIYGYPNKTAAHVALRTSRIWLSNPDNAKSIDRLIFCVFLDRDKHLYKIYMPQYFPKP